MTKKHTFPPSEHLQAQLKPVDSETLERKEDIEPDESARLVQALT